MTQLETVNKIQTLGHPTGKLTCLFFHQINYKGKKDRTKNINDNKLYSELMPVYFIQYIYLQLLKPLYTYTHKHPICICK